MSTDYVVHKLTDFSRLDEIYHLTHDSYVAAGTITPQPDRKVISHPHLDFISETTILIAEKGNQIVGSITVTLDSPHGLHVSNYFKEELDCLRARTRGKTRATTWRLVTNPEYRKNRHLVLDLMREGFNVVHEKACDVGVIVSHKKNLRFYERLFQAELVAEKTALVHNDSIEIPMVMLQCDVQAVWSKFVHRCSA